MFNMLKMLGLFAIGFLFTSGAAAQTCPTPAQLASDLAAASQGQVVDLAGVNPLNCPQVTVTGTWAGGKLVFDDAPESPDVIGRLYEDTTMDATVGSTYDRIFFYHTNGRSAGGDKMKFGILITNMGSSTATLTVQKKGLAGPSTAYVYVGQLAFQRWLNSTAGTPVQIAPGATVRLDSALEVQVSPSYLIHGIYDYSMTQPYKISTCAVEKNDNTLTKCPTLPILPRDGHDRGTFPFADLVYDTPVGTVIDTVNGVQQFPAASGLPGDEYIDGVDETDGTPMTLNGNIGVLYRMHLNTVSSDGQKLGFVINPRGGWWGCAVRSLIGELSQNAILCPSTGGGMSDNTKACTMNRYNPGSGGLSVWVQWMMTGGSNAPVRFIAVPY